MDQIKECLKGLPFFKYLTQRELENIEQNAVITEACKGEILYSTSDACLGFTLCLSGKVRVYIVSDSGREITLYNIGQGESCIMSASCVISQITFETVMTAMEDTEILVINSKVFAQLAENNIYVKEYMYELATKRFSQVMWVMQEILFYGFDKRLAGYLVSEYENTEKTEIKKTQEEIAVNVNSAREVVARMLKHFALEGLIEVKHGTIILKDINGLKRLI